MKRATKRITISLAPGEHDALSQLAHAASEPAATTAGRLIRAALADHGAQLDAPPARRAGPTRPRRARRAADPAPGAEATERLRARYRAELRHAPDPQTDGFVAEQLTALAAWREQLDNDPDTDPRAELAFGHELRTISAWLQARARRTR
jgi:hypothetical protein